MMTDIQPLSPVVPEASSDTARRPQECGLSRSQSLAEALVRKQYRLTHGIESAVDIRCQRNVSPGSSQRQRRSSHTVSVIAVELCASFRVAERASHPHKP